MAHDEYLFTSESVTEGHPDKIADQISDAVLDAILTEDPRGRVACESLLTTGLIVVAGEITTTSHVDISEVARQTVRDVGYTRAKYGFDCETCGVVVAVHKQSPDIAQGVDQGTDKLGAGDQGLMFGYACNETPELMPAPISLAHGLVRRLSEVRRDGHAPVPPAGRQVAGEHPLRGRQARPGGDRRRVGPARPDVPHERLREEIIEHVVLPILPPHMVDRRHLTCHINPTGRFVTGGPHGRHRGHGPQDHRRHVRRLLPARGRRLLRQGSDQGGPVGRLHGPARRQEHRGGRARRAVHGPGGLRHRRGGPGLGHGRDLRHRQARQGHLEQLIQRHFDLTPAGIIKYLDLRRPIYRKTAAFGHFGRSEPEFTWERTDRAKDLRPTRGSRRGLQSMGIRIDELTSRQQEYLASWTHGT